MTGAMGYGDGMQEQDRDSMTGEVIPRRVT